MSQYFRKLKAKWKDPRCRSHGGGRVFFGPDDKVGLRCNRFDLHVSKCKCKTIRRETRQRVRRLLDLYGPNCVRQILADEARRRIPEHATILDNPYHIEQRNKQPLPASKPQE